MYRTSQAVHGPTTTSAVTRAVPKMVQRLHEQAETLTRKQSFAVDDVMFGKGQVDPLTGKRERISSGHKMVPAASHARNLAASHARNLVRLSSRKRVHENHNAEPVPRMTEAVGSAENNGQAFGMKLRTHIGFEYRQIALDNHSSVPAVTGHASSFTGQGVNSAGGNTSRSIFATKVNAVSTDPDTPLTFMAMKSTLKLPFPDSSRKSSSKKSTKSVSLISCCCIPCC